MTEKFKKNSLLGQLEQKGLFGVNAENPYNGAMTSDFNGDVKDFLPFGVLTGGIETSPFENSNFLEEEPEKKDVKIVQKRLNDLDLNIFQEGNFININDEELSNVEKIKKIKVLIKKLEDKTYMLEDSDDEILLNKLKNEKGALQNALKLLEGSDDESAVCKNANEAITRFESKIHLKEKFRKIEKFILKFCPLLHKSLMVRHALNKLVMLNESAKELLAKKIPYGEQEGRYSDFTAYLSCANIIHAKLTKKM